MPLTPEENQRTVADLEEMVSQLQRLLLLFRHISTLEPAPARPTLADLLTLPADRELDRAVAERVMGLALDGDKITDGKLCWSVPPYSTDMAVTMQVLN